MNVLLFGGNGYVGSKVYFSLSSNYQVDSIDLCLFGKDLGYSKKINMFDVFDYINKYDIIICFAGHSSVQMCNYSPNRSWINNVEYFRKICHGMSNSSKLIYASSASVYGNASGISSEDSTCNFNTINHYDLQKTVIDLIANQYIKQNKNIIGLRFGTVNGLSPNIRSELMLNSMVKSALDTGKIYTKNSHIRRSILGINDLAKCVVKIMHHHLPPGQYNIASFSSTVGEMAKKVSELTGAALLVESDDAIAYDFEISADKIKHHLNFEFNDTIDSLVEELISGYPQVASSTRINDIGIERFINEI